MGLFYFARGVIPHHVLMIIIGGDKGNLGMFRAMFEYWTFLMLWWLTFIIIINTDITFQH